IRPGRVGELEDNLVDDNILHAKNFIEDAVSIIQPEWPVTFFTSEVQNSFRQISWHFAGIATLADWLGSDTRYFPYKVEALSLVDY
ncbi:HD domain-containing protein, partial [Streptomyces galilaeus]|uniref:HD domain-containing protein n=1 Tax=Streptomyces galilaeus TaxID=33899 RepID=UPI0038F77C1F